MFSKKKSAIKGAAQCFTLSLQNQLVCSAFAQALRVKIFCISRRPLIVPTVLATEVGDFSQGSYMESEVGEGAGTFKDGMCGNKLMARQLYNLTLATATWPVVALSQLMAHIFSLAVVT